MKDVKRYMEITFLHKFFLKKFSFRANRRFWARKWHVLTTLDLKFSEILHSEMDLKVYEIFITDFCKKDLVGGEWVIVDRQMLCSQNSISALKDLFIILRNERGEKAQGQLNNGFSVFYK